MRPEGCSKLSLAVHPVTSSTVACTHARTHRLGKVLGLAGIDFAGHSVRGASVSAAPAAGITISNILGVADWRSESVFSHYYRHTHLKTHHMELTVMSCLDAVVASKL